jgi:hypothetical protein
LDQALRKPSTFEGGFDARGWIRQAEARFEIRDKGGGPEKQKAPENPTLLGKAS